MENNIVFVWRDDKFAYVGWGAVDLSTRIWESRFDFESELNGWLYTRLKQPPLAPESAVWPSHGNRARSIARLTSKALQQRGFKILSSRDRDTISAGRKPNRWIKAVVHGREQYFRSVRRAAIALGVSPAAITLAAQDSNRHDINYA